MWVSYRAPTNCVLEHVLRAALRRDQHHREAGVELAHVEHDPQHELRTADHDQEVGVAVQGPAAQPRQRWGRDAFGRDDVHACSSLGVLDRASGQVGVGAVHPEPCTPGWDRARGGPGRARACQRERVQTTPAGAAGVVVAGPLSRAARAAIDDRFTGATVSARGGATLIAMAGADQAALRALVTLLWDLGHDVESFSASDQSQFPGDDDGVLP
jgi:hypothetical protein